MPELPEVETVKNILRKQVLNKTISNVIVRCPKIIANMEVDDFSKKLVNQTIIDIKRVGKWLIFQLTDYRLFSHLRMEGKYYIKNNQEELQKHEHVIFMFNDNSDMRYHDTRQFGKFHLYQNDIPDNETPLGSLGYEPFSNKMTATYLYSCFKNKTIPIKSTLLDQTIITGIGNIYDNEILFLTKIHPETKTNTLSIEKLDEIIKVSCEVLEQAIKKGGTTIRSYTSSLGVTGMFQNDLYVHDRQGQPCKICKTPIEKIKINGRGTYFCPKCQK